MSEKISLDSSEKKSLNAVLIVFRYYLLNGDLLVTFGSSQK